MYVCMYVSVHTEHPMHFVYFYISTYCIFKRTCNSKCRPSCYTCFLPYYFPVPDAPADLPTVKDLSKADFQSVPSAAAVKQDILLPPEGGVNTQEGEAEASKLLKNNLTEDKEMEVMDAHEEGAQTEGKELKESDSLNTQILLFSYQTTGSCFDHVLFLSNSTT